MTRVVFETAGLADVLKKAKSISPSRGEAFDKAAGLVVRIDPGEMFAVVEATNLDLYYREWVPLLEVDAAEATVWRVASKISDVVSALPIGSGRTVELNNETDHGHRTLQVKSGRMKCHWQLIDPYYWPEWETFDPDDCVPIENFGTRLAQVEWAASTEEGKVINGVNLDGQFAVATDTYRLARVPLPVHAPWLKEGETLTVPSKLLAQLIKQTGTVHVGATETQLLVIPDSSVQIRTALYAMPYPTGGVQKIMATEVDGKLEIGKQTFIDLINRAMVMLQGDRFPLMDIYIGRGEVAAHAIDQDEGNLGDVVEVPGQVDHPRINYIFTPKFLLDALENSPGDRIELHYSTTNARMLVRVTDGASYNCWVIPRANRPKAGEEAST